MVFNSIFPHFIEYVQSTNTCCEEVKKIAHKMVPNNCIEQNMPEYYLSIWFSVIVTARFQVLAAPKRVSISRLRLCCVPYTHKTSTDAAKPILISLCPDCIKTSRKYSYLPTPFFGWKAKNAEILVTTLFIRFEQFAWWPTSDSMSCSVEFIRRIYCRCYECIVCTYSFVHTIFYLITNLTITTKYQAISHLVRPRTVRQNSYWNPNNINFSQNFIRSYMRRVIYLWTCLTAHKSCITNRKPRPLSFQSEWIKQLRFSHWPLAATHKNYTKCNWILHQKIPRI